VSGFVKLYGSITTSSVWSEPSDTRVVWVTMLAEADADGIIGASLPGLARVANVSLEAAQTAIDTFLAPDPYSRTPENDGRRIEVVDGGWRLLNHKKYRDMRTPSQVAEAERKAAYRARSKGGTVPECPGTAPEIQTEAEAEAYTETEATTPPTRAVLRGIAQMFPSPAAAFSMLVGMTNGMGSPGMKAIPVEVLAEAAGELKACGGDVTPHRYKAFVKTVLSRSHPPRAWPRKPTDKATRGVEALGEWLHQDTQGRITDGK
jgi:hypothetical protein